MNASHELLHGPRKEPRQERSRAMVRAILDATAKVLVEEGWAAATTNRIAEVAGVSVGSLYQYFPNKESLVLTLNREHAEGQLEMLMSHLAGVASLPVDQAVARYVAATIRLHRQEPELHVHLVTQVLANGLVSMREINARAQMLVRGFLEDVRDQLIVEDLDTAAYLLVSTVEAAVHATILDGTMRLEDPVFERELVALVCRYLGVAPSGIARPEVID
jgi:AcrR family transcriptional regulator